MADGDVHHLDSRLLPLYQQWLALCIEAGLAVRATITWRSGDDQNAAKANGLSKAGAGASPHNCCTPDGLPASRAFDFGVFNADASLERSGTDPRYRQAGQIGKSLGLEWGGDWTLEEDGCRPDWDHLQLANWKALDS
jgi:peptidoglycan L-alanyl-D-glutamate endopeptidase CwlK